MKIIRRCLLLFCCFRFFVTGCEGAEYGHDIYSGFTATYKYGTSNDFGVINIGYNGTNKAFMEIFKEGSTEPDMFTHIEITNNGWRQEAWVNGKKVMIDADVQNFGNRMLDTTFLKTVTSLYQTSKKSVFHSDVVLSISLRFANNKLFTKIGVLLGEKDRPRFSWLENDSTNGSYVVNIQSKLLEKVMRGSVPVIELVKSNICSNQYAEPEFEYGHNVETLKINGAELDTLISKMYVGQVLSQFSNCDRQSIRVWISENRENLRQSLLDAGIQFYRNNRCDKKLVSLREEMANKLGDYDEEVKSDFFDALCSNMKDNLAREGNDISKSEVLDEIFKSCFSDLQEGIGRALVDDVKSKLP